MTLSLQCSNCIAIFIRSLTTKLIIMHLLVPLIPEVCHLYSTLIELWLFNKQILFWSGTIFCVSHVDTFPVKLILCFRCPQICVLFPIGKCDLLLGLLCMPLILTTVLKHSWAVEGTQKHVIPFLGLKVLVAEANMKGIDKSQLSGHRIRQRGTQSAFPYSVIAFN